MSKTNVLLVLCSSLLLSYQAAFAQQTGSSILSFTDFNGDGKSDLGVSYFNLSAVPVLPLFKDQKTSLFSYHHMALNYKLDSTHKISIRPVWYTTTEGVDRTGRAANAGTVMGDAHIVYSDYEIYSHGDFNISGSYKLYLPTSANSQRMKTIAQLRGEFYNEYNFGAYSTVTYVFKPEYHLQSQRAFVDDSNPNKVKLLTTRVGKLDHYLEFKQDMNRYYSFLAMPVGFEESWGYDSPENSLYGEHQTSYKAALGVKVRPLKTIDATLYIQNNTMLGSTSWRKDVALFLPENNQFVLLLSANLL